METLTEYALYEARAHTVKDEQLHRVLYSQCHCRAIGVPGETCHCHQGTSQAGRSDWGLLTSHWEQIGKAQR